jgi:hypothetical protein
MFITVYNTFSKIPPPASVLFAAPVRRSLVFLLSQLIFKFLYAGSSIRNASEKFISLIHLYFVNFALHPTSQTET